MNCKCEVEMTKEEFDWIVYEGIRENINVPSYGKLGVLYEYPTPDTVRVSLLEAND